MNKAIQRMLLASGYSPFSDEFNINGSLGIQWTGSKWSVADGVAINIPTLGNEKLSNIEFTSDITSWGSLNGGILTRRDFKTLPDIDPTGGVNDYGLEVQNTTNYGAAGQAITTSSSGVWNRLSCRAYAPSTNTAINAADFMCGNIWGPIETNYKISSEDIWETLGFSGLSINQVNTVKLVCSSTINGDKVYFDAISHKQIDFAECLATLGNCSKEFDMSVKIIRSLRMACGLVVGVDSTIAPMNFLIVWLDGANNIRVHKCLKGAYTLLATTAITYIAGAILRIVKSGTSVSIYYNGAQVGSTITLTSGTDDAIINGTRHGMFSTDPTVSMDDFSIDKKKNGAGPLTPSINQYANYPQYMTGYAGVMFSFDDADDSVYLLAYPILKAKRARGTFYIQTGIVGNAGAVTWANLTTMQNDGWSIGNHTRNHTVLKGIPQADAQIAIKNGHDDLVANGMTAAHHLAYPNGDYDATVIAAAQAEGMVTGRHAATEAIQLSEGYDLFTIGLSTRVTNTTTLTELYWWVDMAIAGKYITNFLIHRVNEATDPTTATVTSLIQYVTDRYIPIITIEDLYILMSGGLNNVPIGP